MTLHFSNFDNVHVVSLDGSFFGLNTAYLIDSGKLEPEQLDQLNEGSDSDVAELAEEVGVDLEEAIKRAIGDSTLVQCIADALWGDGADTQWSADTLSAIAEAFREYRPDLVKGEG